jgi:hypothetical protein
MHPMSRDCSAVSRSRDPERAVAPSGPRLLLLRGQKGTGICALQLGFWGIVCKAKTLKEIGVVGLRVEEGDMKKDIYYHR